MAARLVLAALAVVVIAWTAVLLRDVEVGRDGLSARDPGQLESARLLDPSVYWDQIRAGVLLLNGDADAAAVQAEAVIRAEPDNFAAWSLLRLATHRSDPRRSAQAARALRRLNPLTAP